ncbi:MAG: helix-turn-helix transcriptional regulator [Bacilli bacterium]|nr:helix-turn-helix transcriptional regulator [Bacillales bacterium]MDY2575520.1 helix-turn-helix transcriptional regulator [Bacilli bacterium]
MKDKEILSARQSIIKKFTKARLEKGLTQEQLARLICTKRSNICRIESGTQNLSLDMMLRIAEALEKDISIILKERSKTKANVYSLRLYDEDLITFSLEEKELEGLKTNILYSNTQKAQLRHLIGFHFKRHPSLNLPEERLIAIEKQINDRVMELLAIPSYRKVKQKNELTK